LLADASSSSDASSSRRQALVAAAGAALVPVAASLLPQLAVAGPAAASAAVVEAASAVGACLAAQVAAAVRLEHTHCPARPRLCCWHAQNQAATAVASAQIVFVALHVSRNCATVQLYLQYAPGVLTDAVADSSMPPAQQQVVYAWNVLDHMALQP
jgi:hypothetical protein